MYVGYSEDLKARDTTHNNGGVTSTKAVEKAKFLA